MAIDNNDPRPVLRMELARVFKNQRVIRAFEKIFDLIPPVLIDQQTQIDAVSLIAELGASQSSEAISAVIRVADALEQIRQPWLPYGDNPLALGVNLLGSPGTSETFLRSDVVLTLDQSIVPTWTGEHFFTAVLGTSIASKGVNLGAGTDGGKARWVSAGAATDAKVVEVVQNTSAWIVRLVKDDGTGPKGAFVITRATGGTCAIVSQDYGNSPDNPAHNFFGNLVANNLVRLKGFTVATLPAGTVGDTAYVTDATGPTYNAAVVGGGAVVVKVFYNGAAWVCG